MLSAGIVVNLTSINWLEGATLGYAPTAAMSAYDNAFGPGFADQFDFTIVFENSFMAIVPAVVLLAGTPVYIAHYWKKDAVADRAPLYWAKQVSHESDPIKHTSFC